MDRNSDNMYNRQDSYRQDSFRSSTGSDNRVWNPQTQSWEYRSDTRWQGSSDRMNQDRMNQDRSSSRDQSTFQQNRIYGSTGASKPMVLGIMMEDADQSQISSTQYQQGVK